jgi:hypothetical protein
MPLNVLPTILLLVPARSPNFSRGPSGSLIMLRHTRELVNSIRDGCIHQK